MRLKNNIDSIERAFRNEGSNVRTFFRLPTVRVRVYLFDFFCTLKYNQKV